MNATKTVVVTGASAGVGRAVAREFGRRGCRVGLLARGRAGLNAAADDVEAGGGRALVVPTDVADYDEVDAAAERIEREIGAIDVWVNAAFASVFAPFDMITAEEFRRATEVTYLGFVHGTMAALQRMKPRNRGVIVQVGSALGFRSVPLQSAYCGAKHAIDGFTESLRTELMHDNSNVHVTIVQMPALNTPQFSWVLSRLPKHPQPVPPIYQPEVGARAVIFAAEHPERKQYWVGASTVGTMLGQRFAPALLDRYLARTGFSAQQTERSAGDQPVNLWQPADDQRDYGAHGIFDDRSRAVSRAFAIRRAAKPVMIGVGMAASVGAAARRAAR